jgi:orotidine 5'-phosphate decarboxylase subfamily 1
METFNRPLLCPALDLQTLDGNLRLAEEIADLADAFKVNDDAVDDAGLEALVKPFGQFGRPIFVDMKMLKGSRTMKERAQGAVRLNVALINAFALADKLLAKTTEFLKGKGTRLLAVTVLTHHDENYCQEYFRRSVEESVRFFSQKALDFGCDGFILPAPTLPAVKDFDGIKGTPAIRPVWSQRDANDQELTATPAEAVRMGSNILIAGSPIAKAPNRRESVLRFLEEMDNAWAKVG